MKKVISLSLALLLIAVTLLAAPATVAADDQLTVTANGANPATYRVGDEIVFYVGLNTGDAVVINGHGFVDYDPAYVELVEHTAVVGGIESVEAYSFCRKVFVCLPLLNEPQSGSIVYDFSRPKGVGTFDNADEFFVRFRFKVIAPGQTNICHRMNTMCDYDENYIYFEFKPVAPYEPVMTANTMIATLTIGDVDGNGTVDNRDALILDRYVAGWKGYDALIASTDTADLSGDGRVGNRDAIILDRYLTGWEGYDQYIVVIER